MATALTRQQDIDIVEHLLYTVADFDQGPTQPIPLVMADLGITNFSNFVSFVEADFDGLQFDDAGTLRNLNRGLTKRLQYLLRFTHRMTLENNNIVPPAVDWMNITRNQFLNYLRRSDPNDDRMIKPEQLLLGLFGGRSGGVVKPVERADVYICLTFSAQELPDLEELHSLEPDKTIICFNLKLDLLRGDLGAPAFPGKDFQDRFLSRIKPAYYLRTRQYSRSTPTPRSS